MKKLAANRNGVGISLENLAIRDAMLRAVRDFFHARGYLEVEMPVRIAANLYYLGWAIYMAASGTISKADSFTVTGFYSLNYVVPVIYSVLAVLSRLSRR